MLYLIIFFFHHLHKHIKVCCCDYALINISFYLFIPYKRSVFIFIPLFFIVIFLFSFQSVKSMFLTYFIYQRLNLSFPVSLFISVFVSIREPHAVPDDVTVNVIGVIMNGIYRLIIICQIPINKLLYNLKCCIRICFIFLK